MVGTPDGAFRAYAIKRMAESDIWDAYFIRSLKGTPQQPDPSRKGTKVPISIRFDTNTTEVHAHPVRELDELAT